MRLPYLLSARPSPAAWHEPVAIRNRARFLVADRQGHYRGAISVGSRTDFEAMNRAIALQQLRPVIDRVFPFAEAREGDIVVDKPSRQG